jgi:UDP-N-acetyl-D-mannosaminuronate dehydrogenase
MLSEKRFNIVKTRDKVVVVGLGEIGKPLFELISRRHHTVGVDISPPLEEIEPMDVLHVCYPFQINNFVGETIRYINLFQPRLTVINSTVAVGTTRLIAEKSGAAVVNSPIRGKHARMLDEICEYTKFVGATDPADARFAAEHFESIGLTTKVLSSPEATELAKLAETTYFGLLIAWAQELERYCDQSGANYEEIISFYREVKFFPLVPYFPGIIGGHCVMPNIEILQKLEKSTILEAIRESNQMKIEREARVRVNEQDVERVTA